MKMIHLQKSNGGAQLLHSTC